MISELEYRALEAGIPWNPGYAEISWLYGTGTEPQYAEATDKLLSWSEDRMLTYNGPKCVGWLLAGWRHHCESECLTGPRPWMDHPTWWRGDDDARVLLSNPYSVSPQDIIELKALQELGVEVTVKQPDESWYGRGTYQIELWVTA